MVKDEIMKLWTERPEPPVYLAWVTAGAIIASVLGLILWGVIHLALSLLA